ncbi:hypothetical protein [Streptomyces cyaneofuscatus]|uniref:hypothetical protein n=1 Tax=Streptomyces TaxID=1883 RepID=UPI002E12F07C|nr:hypothetical protein OG366_02105 [Streptomyces cyaneofuscatus]WTF39563.1 hypothetical protein OG973_34445 [Streptomyces cyaneofuscatus]
MPWSSAAESTAAAGEPRVLENHALLPLHLVEDDVTQSRLGEARSKPQRPVAAFAKLLE